MKTKPCQHLALGLAMATLTSLSWAAFPAKVQAGGADLQLNGQGTRYRVVFKVYEMALYTPRPVSTVEQLMALPGPMRLSFSALRELPGTDLGMAFLKGLSANSPKEQVQRHLASTNRLIEIFSGKSKLLPGDHFAMEYLPGKGTQFFILDQPQGAPVGDEEFFRMILRIWVGASPADFQLKDALLAAGRPRP